MIIIDFLRNNYKALISLRFIAFSLLAMIAILWLIVIQLPVFDFLELQLNSISLTIYIIWFIAFVLSILYIFSISPYEYYVYKTTKKLLSDMDYNKAENILFSKSLLKKNIFYLPFAKFKIYKLKAVFYSKQNEYIKAYNLIQDMLKMPLLPYERVEAEILLIGLLVKCGNYRMAKEKLNKFEAKKLSLKHRVLFTLKQSELYFIENNFQKVKDLIEELLHENISSREKIYLLHTLGVAETNLGNLDLAITSYRQAWNEIKKNKNIFAQAEITIDNLAITYLKLGKREEINSFLNKLENLMKQSNIHQQLSLNNIKINIARQLKDREALIKSYDEAEKKLLPNLSGEEKFAYTINSLRMHWNDNIDFDKALKNTKKALLDIQTLTPLKRMYAIREVLGTLKQALQSNGENREYFTFFNWLVLELERLEPEIDKLLENVPAILPIPKRELNSFKIEIIKNKIAYKPLNIELFDSLFRLLKEQANLFKGMQNTISHLNEIMIITDDYIAYKEQLKGNILEKDFEAKFFPMIESILEESEEILKNKENNLYSLDKLIGFSFVYCELGIKKELAKKYIDTFDESKLSIEHYAIWFREQYLQVKKWLN